MELSGLDDGMAESGTPRGVGEAALAAKEVAGQSLANCTTGFWTNMLGDAPAASTSATADLSYPFYVVGGLPQRLKPGDGS